jgi:hypothetical protein
MVTVTTFQGTGQPGRAMLRKRTLQDLRFQAMA